MATVSLEMPEKLVTFIASDTKEDQVERNAMIVISDTTPIISLLKANQLDLLRKLYGAVLIPDAVYRELTENPAYAQEAECVRKFDSLKLEKINGRNKMKT